jgi:N6-L-threonylcarbamoyladenine synthase
MNETIIMGIETSCDETAVGVVKDGRVLLSNVVASQVDIHARYGGIVPEVASRQHVLAIVPTIQCALEEADIELRDLAAVAVTYGPGLAGSLLVGLNFAKSLALSLNLPLVGVNHLEAHIYASWLSLPQSSNLESDPGEAVGFPHLCLIASGGHTDLVLMHGTGQYRLLGRTRDDAAGEAFDKAARILGLGFPGGPEIQRVATGAIGLEKLPRAWLRDTHDFSFSGLKTALLHRAQSIGLYPAASHDLPDRQFKVQEIASAFQESVVDVIVSKSLEAAKKYGARGIILGGGVTANALLRQKMVETSSLPVFIPNPSLCTDNGAMIAACAFHLFCRGIRHDLDLDVDPSLSIGEESK